MKTHLAAAAAALVLTISVATSSEAAIEVNDHVRVYDESVGYPGGVFRVDNITDALEVDFNTFCVEMYEYISPGSEYVVFGIGNAPLNTSLSRPEIYLRPFAAWLYTSFANNSLVTGGLMTLADFSVKNKVNAIQVGIWEGLGYTTPESIAAIGGASNYDSVLLATFHSTFASSGWGAGTGDVKVLNLRTTSGGTAQDQLVIIPGIGNPPPPDMPEPMSFFVWSMLAMCVGVMGRRSRN